MKVFISWSGIRSKYVAEALRNWLPKVIQAIKPWMSNEDISMGTRWNSEISTELSETKVGIICITPENQHNPWVMFEIGALSKTITQSYVCPYLIDLSPTHLSGPAAQFQAAIANKEGTEKILQTLNRALNNAQLPSSELTEIFEVWWPKLESILDNIPTTPDNKATPRTMENMIDEIIQNTREQLRREDIRLTIKEDLEERFGILLGRMDILMNNLFKAPITLEAILTKNPQDQQNTLEAKIIKEADQQIINMLLESSELNGEELKESQYLINDLKSAMQQAKMNRDKIINNQEDTTQTEDNSETTKSESE